MIIFAALRLLANALDIFALGLVAIVSTALASGYQGAGKTAGQLELANFILPLNEGTLFGIGAAILSIFLAKSGLSLWLVRRTSFQVAKIEARLAAELAEEYLESLDSPRRMGFTGSASEFQQTIVYGTSAIGSSLNSVVTLFSETGLTLLMLAFFAIVDPIGVVVMIVYVGAISVTLVGIITPRIREHSLTSFNASQETLGIARDIIEVSREIRVARASKFWVEKVRRKRDQMATSAARVYLLNSLPRYVLELSVLFGVFGLVLGILLFGDLQGSMGVVAVYLLGGFRLAASLVPVQASFNTLNEGLTKSSKTVRFYLDISSQSSEEAGANLSTSDTRESAENVLSVKNLSYTYPEASHPAIDNISFDLKAKTKIAIVGESGSGKTTLADLLAGQLTPSSGQIRIGSLSPRTPDGSPRAAYVAQSPQLITGTLAENISLQDAALTDQKRVIECLRMAGLEKFANTRSLTSVIEDTRASMSGGERQRIGIARALYANLELLVLDEPTSALDLKTEKEVMSTLDKLTSHLTLVIIAHRINTIRNADHIVLISSGQLVEVGSYTSLQSSNEHFANLVSIMESRSKGGS